MSMSDSEGEMDEEGSAEDTSCLSLLDTSVKLDSPTLVIDYDLLNFGFDLRYISSVIGTDDITLIKLVNLVRSRVAEARQSGGQEIDRAYAKRLQEEICVNKGEILQDDKYMIPVDSEDPMLYLLAEVLQGDAEWEVLDDVAAPDRQIEILENELSRCKALIAKLTGESEEEEQGQARVADDAYYFDGYGHLSIHEVMLRDKPRTTTYQQALIRNAHVFEGKVVLDIGCGTGILCMFAAKAGAKKVIGVDSSNIIDKAQRIVRKNGFTEDQITLIKGRLEDIQLPAEVSTVDAIVSEWMGYALYFENMLTSVLFARDKWLHKETGLVLPSRAMVYLEAMAVEGPDDRVGFWSDVYGFDMGMLQNEIVTEAQVQYISAQHVASARCLLHDLDISVAADVDLDFVRPFHLQIANTCRVNGFILSFDVLFDGKQSNGQMKVGFESCVLSTGCEAETTHWKQTVLWLPLDACMQCDAGENISGNMHYQRSAENPRDYLLVVTWSYRGKDRVQTFNLKA